VTASRSFQEIFGKYPAVAASAPGRVNLIGDHTDYNQGFVLPTAIPQQTTVEAAIGTAHSEVYSATLDRTVRFDSGTLIDFARYVGGCVRVLKDGGASIPPLQLRIASDVPVGAGLSSSAALEVAVIRAIKALLDLDLSPDEIAALAHQAEVEHAGVACGVMDQIACSIGEPDLMLFLDTMTMERRLVPLPQGAEMLVINSGIPRALAGTQYNQRRAECEAAAAMLGVPSLRQVGDPSAVERLPSPLKERARHVVNENARVLAAINADAAEFGALMRASHASLRDDYAVSVPAVDQLVAALQRCSDVFGARLTGAGFGGCCVALVAAGQGIALGRDIAAQRYGEFTPTVVVPRIGEAVSVRAVAEPIPSRGPVQVTG
jgi:galactokinase